MHIALQLSNEYGTIRPEIAICVRASQLGLQTRSFETDGNEYTAGNWTIPDEAYVLKGTESELDDKQIQNEYFHNTRTVPAISCRQHILQNPFSTVTDQQQHTENSATMQSAQALRFDQILRPSQTVRDVYMHMIIQHTTVSHDNRTKILDLVKTS